jgi:hypothetical protein
MIFNACIFFQCPHAFLDWIFVVCLAVLGLELRVLHLLGRISSAWITPSALLTLVILEMGSSILFRPAWTVTLPCYASHCSCDDRYIPPCFFPLRWGLVSSLLRMAWTSVLPISPSQVARILSMSEFCCHRFWKEESLKVGRGSQAGKTFSLSLSFFFFLKSKCQ